MEKTDTEYDSTVKAKLMDWMKKPDDDEKLDILRKNIVQYAADHLGFHPFHVSKQFGVVLYFSFDNSDVQVDRFDRLSRASEKGSDSAWDWHLCLARRGAFVTCETFLLTMSDGDYQFLAEEPPRAKAVAWTRDIASAFGLEYLDAKMLRAWEVEYDEIDPHLDFELLSYGGLTAFEVLFHE